MPKKAAKDRGGSPGEFDEPASKGSQLGPILLSLASSNDESKHILARRKFEEGKSEIGPSITFDLLRKKKKEKNRQTLNVPKFLIS